MFGISFESTGGYTPGEETTEYGKYDERNYAATSELEISEPVQRPLGDLERPGPAQPTRPEKH